MPYTGSKKEHFSRIEKGLDMSRTGGGILSRISKMISWGKTFRLVLETDPWA